VLHHLERTTLEKVTYNLPARNIRITPEEIHSLGANTTHRVRTSNGDYVGVLGPWHRLHCLNVLRRVIHMDYYGPRMSEEERGSYLWKQEHSGKYSNAFADVLLVDLSRPLPGSFPAEHHVSCVPHILYRRVDSRFSCRD
jgi:hypothetical protein